MAERKDAVKRDAIFVVTVAIAGTIQGRKKMLERIEQAVEMSCENAPLPNGCDEVVVYTEERSPLEEPQAIKRRGKVESTFR